MRQGRNLVELATEIQRRAEAKKDLIAPAAKLLMTADAKLAVGDPMEPGSVYPIAGMADGQLAEYAEIPLPYYRRMKAEAPELLARNVNRWIEDRAKAGESRMVRTLDGNVRAMLSDKYRRLDNEDLAEAVFPVLGDLDLMVLSAEITERRLYIKAVSKSIERDVPTGRRMGDGSHVFFDTISPGVTVSNSETGDGSLSIEGTVFTKACTNLATFEQLIRKFHTGARAGLSEDAYELLTDGTKKATDAAIWLQVRDIVRSAFDAARFAKRVEKLTEAAGQRIEADPVQVVEVTRKRFGWSEEIGTSVLQRLIEGGDLSRYGLSAAVTRASADVESYDVATEMERVGGELITLPASDWKRIAAANDAAMKRAA